MTTRSNLPRDTAKDIILGAEPSGRAPRQPRDAITAPRVDSAQNSRALAQLQSQLDQIRHQQSEFLNTTEAARRRLEASQESINRRLVTTENMPKQEDINGLRRVLSSFENKMGQLGQEIATIKSSIDRQASDLVTINNEVRNRPVIDPSKLASSTQQMDQRLRELFNQMLQLKQSMDGEISDRIKVNQTQADMISRLQDYIRQQDASKKEVLTNLARKSDADKERLTEESKRLNERIHHLTVELTKNATEREQRLRDELLQKHNAIQQLIKGQADTHIREEVEMQKRNEERWHAQNEVTNELRTMLQQERTKAKERFGKVNDALEALEQHFEKGTEKLDKIVNAEIQSRKLHEKGLLSKVGDVEKRLYNYMNSLTKTVDDVKAGVNNIKIPTLDTDALRRDMESIAADKSKISMEGLLKLEERISRVQHGLLRDRRELNSKMSEAIAKDVNGRLRGHMEKLDDLADEVEKTQTRIRDKVERQIPQDLSELSAKVDNVKSQLTNRIDEEEEERYLAIKELQEAYGKLATGGIGGLGNTNGGPATSASLKRDVDECKVAIKKLAESVTTVKNVLDRKVQEEIRRREQDVEVLGSRIDSIAVQALQKQS